MGDGAQLHRVRTALGGRHHDDVRRRARLSATRSLLEIDREVSGQHFLHVADCDSCLRAAGRSVAECPRYVELAAAGVGGGADQSRSLGVVLQDDRQGTVPDLDTWWQTETGAIMIAPMPGAVPLNPGSGTLPLPGVIADVV